ncbi:MAG: hypothetical protein ACTSYA_02990 [Candidatus Kariarchaeaceae archaeon]
MATQDFMDKSITTFRSTAFQLKLVVNIVRLASAGFFVYMLLVMYNVLLDECFEFSNIETVIVVVVLTLLAIVIAVLSLPLQLLYAFGIDDTIIISATYVVKSYTLNYIFSDVSVVDGMSTNSLMGSSLDSGDMIDYLFTPFAYLFNKPQRVLYNHQILLAIILLMFIFMIITGISFVRYSDVGQAGIAFGLSQVIIILALMKNLTVSNFELDTSSIGSLMGSNLFITGFIPYLFLEFALQTSYINNLISPTLQRQKRVEMSLDKLREFKLSALRADTGEEEKPEEETRESTALTAGGTGSQLAKKFGAQALVFLLDSASDSLFARPGGEKDRMTGRLQRYHENLVHIDPKVNDKLAGTTTTINPVSTLIFVLLSMGMRLVLMISMAWLLLNPALFMFVFRFPDSVVYSIELAEPEGVLIVLLPFIFILIILAQLIGVIKNYFVKGVEVFISEEQIGQLLSGELVIDQPDVPPPSPDD